MFKNIRYLYSKTTTLDSDVSNLSNKFDAKHYYSSTENYTTGSWGTGTGGCSITVPEDGWYIIRARFASVSGSDNYWVQLQIKFKYNGAEGPLIYDSVPNWNGGTMPVKDVYGFSYLAKDTVLVPHMHCGTGGIIVSTEMGIICIQKAFN